MSKPTYFLPIAGTWDWNEDERIAWWEQSSPFINFMNSQNFFLKFPECPFEWSTGLEGLPFTKYRQWKAGAKALGYYMDGPSYGNPWPLEDRNFIVHSYGLYIILYYASWGGKINNLISIGSPIRHDVNSVALLAKANIKGTWLHLRDEKFDFIGTLGGFFDKNVGFARKNPWCTREDALDKVGHSDLIKKPEKFYHWLESNRLEVLRNVSAS